MVLVVVRTSSDAGCNSGSKTAIRGRYRRDGLNHGKLVYRSDRDTPSVGHDAVLYFWDDRDGPSYNGWWFGTKVGGVDVWAFNPKASGQPPRVGWRVPWNGPVSQDTVVELVEPLRGRHIQDPGKESPLQRRARKRSPPSSEDESEPHRKTLKAADGGAAKANIRKVFDEAAISVARQVEQLQELLDSTRKDRDNAHKERDAARKKRDNALARCNELERTLAQQKETSRSWELRCHTAYLHAKESQQKLRALQDRVRDSAGIDWQYELAGHWCSFGADASEQVHKAYIAFLESGTDTLQVRSGGELRKIMFQTMTQMNTKTGTRRKIRLNVKIPPIWELAPNRLMQQKAVFSDVCVLLDPQSIHDAMKALLSRSSHTQCAAHPGSVCPAMSGVSIQSVHRVENLHLWQSYLHRLRQLEDAHARRAQPVANIDPQMGTMAAESQRCVDALSGSSELSVAHSHVNEKWLLHGTTASKMENIVAHGFDHRLGMRGMYGAGTYFASQGCKAHQYTCATHPCACRCTQTRHIVVARVVLGDPFFTRSKLGENQRRPPERPASEGGGAYDSVVANPGPMEHHQRGHQDHQELVIFDNCQAYPAYVVQYVVTP